MSTGGSCGRLLGGLRWLVQTAERNGTANVEYISHAIAPSVRRDNCTSSESYKVKSINQLPSGDRCHLQLKDVQLWIEVRTIVNIAVVQLAMPPNFRSPRLSMGMALGPSCGSTWSSLSLSSVGDRNHCSRNEKSVGSVVANTFTYDTSALLLVGHSKIKPALSLSLLPKDRLPPAFNGD